jgi:hypothetical protein
MYSNLFHNWAPSRLSGKIGITKMRNTSYKKTSCKSQPILFHVLMLEARVVNLTAFKFKLLIFSMSGFALFYAANMFSRYCMTSAHRMHKFVTLRYIYIYTKLKAMCKLRCLLLIQRRGFMGCLMLELQR